MREKVFPSCDCILAAGLDGVRRKLKPPAAFSGDMYAAASLPTVPGSLREATELFEASAFARKVLGDEVVGHYAHFARNEQASFDAAVTDWERKRYFERI